MKWLNDPMMWRRFALANVVVWTFIIAPAELFGWVNDPAYISRLSEVALQLAALSWWQSTRVEVKQYQDADVKEVLDWLRNNRDSYHPKTDPGSAPSAGRCGRCCH